MVVKKKVTAKTSAVKKVVAKKTATTKLIPQNQLAKARANIVTRAPVKTSVVQPNVQTKPAPVKPQPKPVAQPVQAQPKTKPAPAKPVFTKAQRAQAVASILRIPSGVPGLDPVIEGGFEKNSAVLVSGSGGSGKTIFGLQFLLEGIKNFDETGVYISFEESKEKFYKHMLRFGWDLAELERTGRFVFIRYSPEKMAEMVEMGGKTIGKELQEINGKRIVIDSLSAYTVLFDKESDQRRMLVNLFTMIEGWDATTIVIAEENPDIEKFHSSVMGFMADAIVYVYNLIKENTMVRAMQIAKMRGTKHTHKIFPLLIADEGISAYPDQDIFEHDFGRGKVI